MASTSWQAPAPAASNNRGFTPYGHWPNQVCRFKTTLAPAKARTISAGVIGLNDDTQRDGNVRIREEAVDRIMGFWNHTWEDQWAVELSLGYEFSHVDEAVFGAQLAYSLTRSVDNGLLQGLYQAVARGEGFCVPDALRRVRSPG